MEEMLGKTKKLLKAYRVMKYAVTLRTEDVEAQLLESDMKTLSDLVDSVLGEDLMMNTEQLTEKLEAVRTTAIL